MLRRGPHPRPRQHRGQRWTVLQLQQDPPHAATAAAAHHPNPHPHRITKTRHPHQRQTRPAGRAESQTVDYLRRQANPPTTLHRPAHLDDRTALVEYSAAEREADNHPTTAHPQPHPHPIDVNPHQDLSPNHLTHTAPTKSGVNTRTHRGLSRGEHAFSRDVGLGVVGCARGGDRRRIGVG